MFFLDGMNESGFRKTRTTDFLTEAFKPANEKFWNIYKLTFPTFVKSLPVVQLSNRLLKKIFNFDLDENVGKAGSIRLLPDDLLDVYEHNINIRAGICNFEKINCYSFLQPFASVHGVYFDTRDGLKLKIGDKLGGAPEIGKLDELSNLKQKFNFPISIINGKDDINYIKEGRIMLKLNNNSKQYIINNASHNVHLENKEMYLDVFSDIYN